MRSVVRLPEQLDNPGHVAARNLGSVARWHHFFEQAGLPMVPEQPVYCSVAASVDAYSGYALLWNYAAEFILRSNSKAQGCSKDSLMLPRIEFHE